LKRFKALSYDSRAKVKLQQVMGHSSLQMSLTYSLSLEVKQLYPVDCIELKNKAPEVGLYKLEH